MSEAASAAVSAAEALRRGDVATAVETCRRGLAAGEDGELRYLLGVIAGAGDLLDEACHEWEAAFRAFSRDGEVRRAARVATLLGEMHWGGLGKPATGRGWLERARRLLEPIGPCVELGYWELARVACDRADADALAASAERAMQIASAHGDVALHVRALADSGVAFVNKGAVTPGLARLDEALACIAAGEVSDVFVIGTSFCALLTAAERIGDVERVTEWSDAIHKLLLEPGGGRPVVLRSHCSIALGGVLVHAGRWTEAEEVLQASLAGSGPARVSHRVDALARLAELRVLQGREQEAAELLAPFEDHVAVAGPLAAVHLARGEPALAVAVAQRALAQLVGDALRAAPLLLAVTDAEIRRGNLTAAAEAAARLDAIAAQAEPAFLAAAAAVAAGRVALAAGDADDAVRRFGEATGLLSAGDHQALLAAASLDLADAFAALDSRDAAVIAARAGHAGAERLGAAPLRDRAASILRRLGAPTPRAAVSRDVALSALTSREREVLDGLHRGETNAEIAARLYLSPKTVEHHVSRLLTKLGVKTRAQAAAISAAARVLDPGSDRR